MVRTVVLDVAVAVLAAFVGAGLALDGAELWTAPPAVVVGLVVAAAVLAVASTTVHAVVGVRARRLAARRDLLDELLRGALWAVVDRTGLDARDLAAAVYEVSPSRWWRPASLRRAHRVRAGRRPVSSEVRWAPGKGVLGRCVATGDVVAVDVSAWEASVTVGDAAAWDALPEASREGLSFPESTRLRGKYAVVVAVPLVDDSGPRSRVTGCVALDGPRGSLDRLRDPVVLGVLAATGAALQGVSAAPRALGVGGAQSAHRTGEDLLEAALDRQGTLWVQRRPGTVPRVSAAHRGER